MYYFRLCVISVAQTDVDKHCLLYMYYPTALRSTSIHAALTITSCRDDSSITTWVLSARICAGEGSSSLSRAHVSSASQQRRASFWNVRYTFST